MCVRVRMWEGVVRGFGRDVCGLGLGLRNQRDLSESDTGLKMKNTHIVL